MFGQIDGSNSNVKKSSTHFQPIPTILPDLSAKNISI